MKRILIVLTICLMQQVVHAEEMDRGQDKKSQQRRGDRQEDRKSEERQRDGEKKPLVVIRKDKEKERPD